MATLDAQVELLNAETDEQCRAARIASLQTRSRDLGRLTGQLLNHAMVIHRSEAILLAALDLNALVKDVLGRNIRTTSSLKLASNCRRLLVI